jgi:hypothetical protein
MGFDGFTMPPSIAGEKNEVTPDADGASNLVSVTGGLTLVALAAGGAMYLKDRLMAGAGVDADSNVTLSVN